MDLTNRSRPWVPCPGTLHTIQWRHNERDGVSNHQPHDGLLRLLFRRRSKKTSKLRVTGLCEGNSPVTGEFPAQRSSNAENVSIWWRHHEILICFIFYHDFDEIFWPQPIRSLKLVHVTGQGSMSLTWVGQVFDPGRKGFHKKCKNLDNIAVYLITSLKSKWKNKQIKDMNSWIW